MSYEITWFHKETNKMESQISHDDTKAMAIFKAVIRDGHKAAFITAI